MRYKKGFKYQLIETETFLTNIFPEQDIINPFISLSKDGTLTGRPGYAWDGPSGPTIDRKTNMRASLGHDMLCQLLRERKISIDYLRRTNHYMGVWCKEDGMMNWLAYMYVRELNNFGSFAADPKNVKKILEAP